MRKAVSAVVGLAALVLGATGAAAESDTPLPHVNWSFSGPFGTYDRRALQHGFEIYQNVCSACHSLNLVHYHDLSALGYTDEQIKAIAAQKQVADINDAGQPIQRPARPSDAFVAPFPNEKAARAANNGALPPDQSLLVKAREGGADYIYGILTDYATPPADLKVPDGMYYDKMFPSDTHEFAMPQPLQDGSVTYDDGTKPSLDQEAADVTTFLAWAADPTMEERKQTGAKVIIFLVVLTLVLYAAKRKIWAALH
jgi:ubiquinol-cytochrome c reductase cytochrome c1 subunit